VVDNGETGFSTTGYWAESDGQGFWGTPSIYTDEAGATAKWTPSLAYSGPYEVLIRWTKTETMTNDAQYTVNYAGGSQAFTIDQSGGQDAKWVSLGQFQFNAGTSGNVILESTSVGETTTADATLFRLIPSGSNQVPTASFMADPTSGVAPLEVSFDATGSTDPDGTVESYAWNFDDGATGSGVTVNHTFDDPGTYTVMLIVMDNGGASAADTAVVSVSSSTSHSGIIIDNLDAEFTTTGNWYKSGAEGAYVGSSLYATADGATATWTPNLSEAGTYLVSAWWPHWPTRAENAPYTIIHANGSDTVRVNQRENGGQWVLLGAYEFRTGTAGTGSVTVTREAGDGSSTSADAIRFKIVNNIHLPVVLKNW
jgi:PKD repeat protein